MITTKYFILGIVLVISLTFVSMVCADPTEENINLVEKYIRLSDLKGKVVVPDSGADGSYNWSCSQIKDFKIAGIPSVFLIDKKV